MEVKFWKHESLFYGSLFCVGLTFIGVISFIIITIMNKTLWIGLLFFLCLFILSILQLFLDKKTLSKIFVTNDGIKELWLNKELCFIKWEDIIDVEDTTYAWGGRYLSFTTANCTLHIGLTQKKYDTIMAICPIPNLKVRINEIEYFKCFHKNDNK